MGEGAGCMNVQMGILEEQVPWSWDLGVLWVGAVLAVDVALGVPLRVV